MPGHFGCHPRADPREGISGHFIFFGVVEKMSPAKSGIKGPPLCPRTDPGDLSAGSHLQRAFSPGLTSWVSQSMSRPRRAEGWALEAFSSALPPPAEVESPKAPRILTMRERQADAGPCLHPAPCPLPLRAAPHACGGWNRGRGSPGGVQGPSAILRFCPWMTGLGRRRVCLRDPLSLPQDGARANLVVNQRGT